MATVYPLARPSFLADPLLGVLDAGLDVLFLPTAIQPQFYAEPAVVFNYLPFDESFIEVDTFRILDEQGNTITDGGDHITW